MDQVEVSDKDLQGVDKEKKGSRQVRVELPLSKHLLNLVLLNVLLHLASQVCRAKNIINSLIDQLVTIPCYLHP